MICSYTYGLPPGPRFPLAAVTPLVGRGGRRGSCPGGCKKNICCCKSSIMLKTANFSCYEFAGFFRSFHSSNLKSYDDICGGHLPWPSLKNSKCHDFLPYFSPRRPFGVQKWPSRLFAFLFWLPTKLEDKKSSTTAFLLATFWRPKLQKDGKRSELFCPSKGCKKRRQKVAELFLSSDCSATFFGRQKVVHAKRTAKSRGTCIQL